MTTDPANWHHPVNTPTPVNGPITLAEYDPAWPAQYAREEARIRAALGDRALLVEHIGSTAVPGLAAKPIIDILLAVANVADEDAYLPDLEAAGYVLRIREPDPTSELFNDEEPHRVFKGSEINLNLHVYSAGSGEITRLLRMRDWLRTNDADRDLYERAKRHLAARDWENVQQYANAKDDVIAEIGARAAVWANRVEGEAMPTPELLVEDHERGRIAVVTLNRPAKRNALSRSLARALAATVADLARRQDLRAVVLTGAGDRAFCAGADLTERRSLSLTDQTAHTHLINTAAEAVATLPMPVIAAIRGYALAGGAELAAACDLRVAASDAIFGFPEVRIGIFPGAGGVLRLPQLVGSGAARDLLYTGRRIDAAAAFRIGLVDRLVSPDDVLPIALALAGEIAANAPLAVRALKAALTQSANQPPDRAQRIIMALRDSLDGTRDYAEGLAAFAEHREPDFHGE